MHSRLQHEMHHAQTQLPSWPDPWQSVPVLKLALKLLSQTIDYLEVVSRPHFSLVLALFSSRTR